MPVARAAPLVLLVDDYTDNRAMYVRYLKFVGYEVAEATNGEEALDQARRLLPDMIVMDLSLPVMDGWEATRRLKRGSKTRGIPVLALTGHALGDHEREAKDAGCDGYITKPCLPEHLAALIKGMLEGRAAPIKTRRGRARRG